MAIYHCSLRTFSRSDNCSAVAAAAYRAGAVLKDERTGRIHRYQNRRGVNASFILAPSSTPEQFLSRATLWNAAEASETRKNSRVAREVILALPHELTDTERQALARDMALYLVERYRVVVDVAIHSPCEGDGHDPRNHHAHLLFTTRELTPEGFGAKTRILDDKESGPQEVELLREVWETLANDALSRAGFTDIKIDRRTLEGQGIDRIPQTHIGPEAKASDTSEAKQDEEEEDGKKEGEQGKSGSAGGASGKGEKGGSGDAFPPKVAKEPDSKKRDIEYKAIDQGRRRADFVEEIKRLNERRAAFSDIPLKDQIAEIEKLIEKLDHRVHQLETLKEKTGLGHRLMVSFSKLVEFSKDLVLGREVHREAVTLSETERATRAERHKEHYGRTYRTGLHEQIKTMRSQLDRLEHLKSAHTAYKGFVERIEKEALRTQPSITTSQKEQIKSENLKAAFKIITPAELALKLSLKAEMVRAIIPPAHQPKEPTIAKPEPTIALKAELNRVATPPKPPQTLTPNFREQIIPPTRERAPNIASYRQPIKLEIKELSRAIQERQAPSRETKPEKSRTETPSYRQPMKVEIKAMKEAINERMKESARAERTAPQPDPESLKGQFRQQARSEPPPREAHYEQSRAKTREEAQAKRESVDPKYRAEPYEQEHPHKPEQEKPEAQATSEPPHESSTNEQFKEEAAPKTEQPHQEQTEKPRKAKMSEGFNSAAKERNSENYDSAPHTSAEEEINYNEDYDNRR